MVWLLPGGMVPEVAPPHTSGSVRAAPLSFQKFTVY